MSSGMVFFGNRNKFEDRFKEREGEAVKIMHKNITIMYINTLSGNCFGGLRNFRKQKTLSFSSCFGVERKWLLFSWMKCVLLTFSLSCSLLTYPYTLLKPTQHTIPSKHFWWIASLQSDNKIRIIVLDIAVIWKIKQVRTCQGVKRLN